MEGLLVVIDILDNIIHKATDLIDPLINLHFTNFTISIDISEKIQNDKVETDKVETDKVETDKVETDKVETNLYFYTVLEGIHRLTNFLYFRSPNFILQKIFYDTPYHFQKYIRKIVCLSNVIVFKTQNDLSDSIYLCFCELDPVYTKDKFYIHDVLSMNFYKASLKEVNSSVEKYISKLHNGELSFIEELLPVHHVFSKRYGNKKMDLKKNDFGCDFLGLDDDILAWEKNQRDDVTVISAFHPLNDSTTELESFTAKVKEKHKQTGKKVCVLFDLDKTLYSSKDDIKILVDRNKAPFNAFERYIEHFFISGRTIFNDDSFNHSMNIRPGVAKMLREIKPIAEVYAITWGDICYAREAVRKANNIRWEQDAF
jgi:hypothetical protein